MCISVSGFVVTFAGTNPPYGNVYTTLADEAFLPFTPNAAAVGAAAQTSSASTNTAAIVATYGNSTTYAAGYCAAKGAGWYLPDITDMNGSLWTYRNALNAYKTNSYWSSRESVGDTSTAFGVNTAGTNITNTKTTQAVVRCIRRD